ncbi:hypothetical protein [Enterococcus sp.]|uniref:hypothetical protein n=1 Tax=Enterococcus sp. TaxID=35783 RepID=UPI00290F6BEF|nr:hypothetical protein [Enterococcus sp.]MDU5333093.1 hypothetical protein [Enterococcus sp.]
MKKIVSKFIGFVVIVFSAVLKVRAEGAIIAGGQRSLFGWIKQNIGAALLPAISFTRCLLVRNEDYVVGGRERV